ncbi:MAG: hypothetical protein HPY65_03105 [Syntrophaceae bacterium]|nr:hypothetical protein [Syntrophaceae bacterium]
MTDIATWDILKWVLLVLLAGFIGQFGKSFAQAVMARIRKRKSERAAPPARIESAGTTAMTGDPETLPGPEGPDGPGPGRGAEGRPSVLPSPGMETPAAASGADKKALKTLAKQRKKEEKLRSKLSK